MADLQTLQREGFKDIHPIGSGQFGTVFRATHDRYGLIALKTIPRPKFSDGEIQAAQAMEHSPNKYIIRTRKIKQVDDFYLVVMEYADHGSLKSFMEQFGPFQEHDAGRFISNILEGLAALHEQNIMHRDMKPDNVLLHEDPDTKDLIAKITDFGLARSVPDQNLAVTHCGTPLYMAPEVCLDNKPYDIRADIWGVGIIFYELLTNSHPFPAKNLRDLLDMIKKPFSPIPYISQQCKDVLDRLLQFHPQDRFSARQALDMPFFRQFKERQRQLQLQIPIQSQPIPQVTTHPPQVTPLPQTPPAPKFPSDSIQPLPLDLRHRQPSPPPNNQTPRQTTSTPTNTPYQPCFPPAFSAHPSPQLVYPPNHQLSNSAPLQQQPIHPPPPTLLPSQIHLDRNQKPPQPQPLQNVHVTKTAFFTPLPPPSSTVVPQKPLSNSYVFEPPPKK